MIRGIFPAQPLTMSESCWEHFDVASRFGSRMLVGDTVRTLHMIMIEKRGATRDAAAEMLCV